ncbi:OsmC family protein [Nitrosopumilus ureiphilus]|uniref:Osmotically inducible protein C n=1 Tax=Nitrosopumilus ureiphilus TaxID=1470067 RepID=A0A7D5M4C7_9ARCH|nr:OsmC family protein [Nitrosopumilus ureiphilus]QLH06015.1 osmotically inducible protein C [Nitrosopumilus ureiphilus]
MNVQTRAKMVNGVNVTQLFETIDSIKENGEIAKFNFRVQNKWVGGTENHTTVNDYYGACKTHTRSKPHTFVKDEPPVLLGKDRGANPVEYLLAGLAGCVTTSLVAHAAARGVKIDSIESTLEGNIDLHGLLQLDDTNPGYQGINISFKIKSDTSDEILQELIELAKKASPVANTISRPTPVNVKLIR